MLAPPKGGPSAPTGRFCVALDLCDPWGGQGYSPPDGSVYPTDFRPLTRYKGGVVNWAQKEVALATKENLVVYRVDGTFKGASGMTRSAAAVVVYRLFQKIW